MRSGFMVAHFMKEQWPGHRAMWETGAKKCNAQKKHNTGKIYFVSSWTCFVDNKRLCCMLQLEIYDKCGTKTKLIIDISVWYVVLFLRRLVCPIKLKVNQRPRNRLHRLSIGCHIVSTALTYKYESRVPKSGYEVKPSTLVITPRDPCGYWDRWHSFGIHT